MRALTWQANETVEVIDEPGSNSAGSTTCCRWSATRPTRSGVLSFATHHLPLEEAPQGHEIFRDKAEGCLKIVLIP